MHSYQFQWFRSTVNMFDAQDYFFIPFGLSLNKMLRMTYLVSLPLMHYTVFLLSVYKWPFLSACKWFVVQTFSWLSTNIALHMIFLVWLKILSWLVLANNVLHRTFVCLLTMCCCTSLFLSVYKKCTAQECSCMSTNNVWNKTFLVYLHIRCCTRHSSVNK